MNCRHCKTPLQHTFVDLGFAPPSNAYLRRQDLLKPEKYYPLRVKVCEQCWLVQTEDYTHVADLFSADYAYFSSTSRGWLEHSANFVRLVTEKFKLGHQSHVIEIASNDGYLLRNFIASGIPCLGIEPTAGTAAVAEGIGIPVIREFFTQSLGEELFANDKQADLIIGNNVYAHVPDINDFTLGLKAALKQNGTITLEFPHLLRLIEHVQFDTIYHEHFSYLSLFTVSRIFNSADLRIWNVEELPTHGGSLRVYGCHLQDPRRTSPAVESLLSTEKEFGLQSLAIYQEFQAKADRIKDNLVKFLIEKKQEGSKVVAYGAAAKGATLLNYAGIKTDLISVVCDAAPAKQGKFMPGCHIPIHAPSELEAQNASYVLILPWNIAQEVQTQNIALIERGVRFLVASPQLRVI